MTTRRHAVGLLVLCAVLWSTGGLLIKWLPGSAFAIAGVRSALAAAVLLLALREWPGRWSWWLGSGVLAGAASMPGFVVATKLTTAANAIFLVYTAPLYVALLSPWVLHEPIRRGAWLTLMRIAWLLLLNQRGLPVQTDAAVVSDGAGVGGLSPLR